MLRKRALALPVAIVLAGGALMVAGSASAGSSDAPSAGSTRTPIRHLVVIFQENVSFDHYFGTYPNAANTDGNPFHAAALTPAVDGLPPATAPSIPLNRRHATNLLSTNPNAALPQRLSSSVADQLTCDQDHEYNDEQTAFDNGRMDHFVQSVGTGSGSSPTGAPCNANQVMDYYDGNTVTALWNYAQSFSMSDNHFGSTFGPSTPGAINLISGNTGTVDTAHQANNPPISTPTAPDGDITPNGLGGYSLTSDAQPYWDDCSYRDAIALNGPNIGTELNDAGLSWGWFQGGFRPYISYRDALKATGNDPGQPTSTFIPNQFTSSSYFSEAANRPAHSSNQGPCSNVHPIGVALGGNGQYGYKDDYIPHHDPFQYYAATANPHHLTIPTEPSGQDTLAGLAGIGHDTQSYVGGVPQFNTPNHNYDISDFDQLVAAITKGQLPPSALPAVSFLKAPGYQDGHAGYSDPTDEQQFVVNEINALEASPDWSSTAVIVLWDDSDGWYDHVYSGVTNPSVSPADNLTDTTFTLPQSGHCGPLRQPVAPLAGQQGRCGFGPRIPFLVISPFARRNHVDHRLIDQSSVLNFIEYNWGLPAIPGSFDQVLANRNRADGIPFDIAGQFEWSNRNPPLFLNPSTGEPTAAPAAATAIGAHERSHRHRS